MSVFSEIAVCDTETTGFEPDVHSLLEVALCGADFGWSHFVEYEGDIPPDARSVHHISPEEVRPGAYNCLPRQKAVENLSVTASGRVLVFHNAEFDLGFLPEFKTHDVICTYRVAKHVYPDAPNLKNQTLRYWLGVEPRRELIEGLAPHRGLYDVAVTLAIVERMLESYTIEELLAFTQKPVLLKTVGFGKHKGLTWEQVARQEPSYLAWMRRSGNWDKDVDVMHTLDVLQGRKAA